MTRGYPKKNHPQTSKQTNKDIFWYESTFSILFVKIVAMIVIIGGIGMLLRESNTTKREMQQEKALQLFAQIDDLAHKQFADMESRGNPSNFTGFELFEQIDSGYHNAKTGEEKFARIKKMITFFDQMDEYLHRVGGLDTTGDQTRDKEYHEIREVFDTVHIQ